MPDDIRVIQAWAALLWAIAPAALLVVAVGVLAGVADMMTLSAVSTSRRGGRS